MFYLQPVTHDQDMTDSWQIWDRNYNLRMVKNKDWKEFSNGWFVGRSWAFRNM